MPVKTPAMEGVGIPGMVKAALEITGGCMMLDGTGEEAGCLEMDTTPPPPV